MRAAGIRLDSARLIWVEAADYDLKPLDRVLIRLGEAEVTAEVHVTPEQLLRPADFVQGQILTVYERDRPSECRDIPGTDLPPLGSELKTPEGTRTVVQVDVLQRRVAVRTGNEADVLWVVAPGDAALESSD